MPGTADAPLSDRGLIHNLVLGNDYEALRSYLVSNGTLWVRFVPAFAEGFQRTPTAVLVFVRIVQPFKHGNAYIEFGVRCTRTAGSTRPVDVAVLRVWCNGRVRFALKRIDRVSLDKFRDVACFLAEWSRHWVTTLGTADSGEQGNDASVGILFTRKDKPPHSRALHWFNSVRWVREGDVRETSLVGSELATRDHFPLSYVRQDGVIVRGTLDFFNLVLSDQERERLQHAGLPLPGTLWKDRSSIYVVSRNIHTNPQRIIVHSYVGRAENRGCIYTDGSFILADYAFGDAVDGLLWADLSEDWDEVPAPEWRGQVNKIDSGIPDAPWHDLDVSFGREMFYP